MISEFHAKAINAMKNGKLGGIYARNKNKAMELGNSHNCPAYSNVDELLKNEEIDVVTIATPSGAHLESITASAKACKHIICEKPLEINTARIRDAIKVCKDYGVTLGGIFNRRFNPAVEAFKEATTQNRFGKITLCDAQVKWYRDQAYYDSAEWRGTWELDGGGALMNQSIHTIDLMLYLLGEVARVSATSATLTHENIEVEDTVVAILEFINGARGVIQASTSCWSSTGHPAEIQVCGSEGSVFLSDDQFRIWDFKHKITTDQYVKENLMSNKTEGLGANDPKAINYLGHQQNFEDFVDAIETNRRPLITAEEAMKSVALINTIYASAKSGGKWTNMTS